MYIYDRQLLGPQDRAEEQPIILRPSRRYHYANPDAETPTGIYRLALAGLVGGVSPDRNGSSMTY